MRWLVIACIVPLWLTVVGVSWLADSRERDARVAAAERHAELLMNAVDGDLAVGIAAMQTLSATALVDDANYTQLQAGAVLVRDVMGAFNVFLVAPSMQVLTSADRPAGALQVRLPVDRLPAVLAEGRPAVSDLFIGAVNARPLVSLGVPVLRPTGPVGRLEMVMSPERFDRVLDQLRLPAEWSSFVHDSQGTVVAGTAAHRAKTGLHMPPALLPVLLKASLTTNVTAPGTDGADSLHFHSRSQRHGWGVVIEVPARVFDAERRRRQTQIAIATALVLLGGLALAGALAGRLSAPIHALADPALAIGRGEEATITPTPFREINVLGAALQQAQHLLRQRGRARQAAEASLRDSQSRLRLAMDAARIGDWDLDLRTQVMQRSPMHDQCFGHDRPLAAWSLERLYERVHADDREMVCQTVQAALATTTPWQADFRVTWPDGSVHWLSARGTFLSEGGQAVRMLGTVMDITARKQGERLRLEGLRLQIENRQILEAHRLKSAFLANMSHELRTPLNAVIGFADILQSDRTAVDESRRREYLGHIAASGRHLLRLINDVLDLAKVEAGRLEFRPETVHLDALATEVCGVLMPEAERKGITLCREISPSLPALLLDPDRLRQVLYNYLSNALKFTGEGGRVVVRAAAEGEHHFRLEVEDTGIGIAPADQAKLFTPFQQVHGGTGKPHQGTGLGLALTMRRVQLQGGSVGLRSAVGVGSVFHAVLPLRMDRAATGSVVAD